MPYLAPCGVHRLRFLQLILFHDRFYDRRAEDVDLHAEREPRNLDAIPIWEDQDIVEKRPGQDPLKKRRGGRLIQLSELCHGFRADPELLLQVLRYCGEAQVA